MDELKEPLVSIIMPVYNGERYLENTINAICESQYKNIELLCIDDCSRDNSVEICKKFAEKEYWIANLQRKLCMFCGSR